MSFWKKIKNGFGKKQTKFIPNNIKELLYSFNKTVLSYDFNFKTSKEILLAYYEVPQVQAVVNYLASLFSDGKPTVSVNVKDGQQEIISNHWFTELLKNPHPLYSEGEFLKTFYKQYALFGSVIMVDVKPVAMQTSGMFILPFQDVQVKIKEGIKAIDIIYATEISEIIDYYILNYKGTQTKFYPEDIYVLSTTSMRFDQNGFIVPDSPIAGIKQPINNILSQYKARNTIVDKRGALGILSNAGKDTSGTIPLDEDDVQDIHDRYGKYGLTGQDYQLIITNAALSWQSMTMPIKDLQLLEGIKEDKVAICDAWQFPIQLLNSLEASTLNNFQTADKIVYTKKIIPDNNIISKSWTNYFLDQNETFYFDISHVDVLQEDRKLNVDIAKEEIQIIIDLNSSISSREMTKENAVNALVILTDINEKDANLILNESPEAVETVEPSQDPEQILLENE